MWLQFCVFAVTVTIAVFGFIISCFKDKWEESTDFSKAGFAHCSLINTFKSKPPNKYMICALLFESSCFEINP